MTDREFANVFAKTYKEVATTAAYDMSLALKIGFGNGIKAIDMPKEMTSCVEKYGGGCCFHHSWRLIHKLSEVGITSYWAVVPEPTEERPRDQKCVVVYETPDGNRYVADIVEDVKAGIGIEDFIGDGCKWVNSSGEIIDNSKITLEKMAKISDSSIVSGYLRIYPKPDENILFDDYLITSNYDEILA